MFAVLRNNGANVSYIPICRIVWTSNGTVDVAVSQSSFSARGTKTSTQLYWADCNGDFKQSWEQAGTFGYLSTYFGQLSVLQEQRTWVCRDLLIVWCSELKDSILKKNCGKDIRLCIRKNQILFVRNENMWAMIRGMPQFFSKAQIFKLT